MNGIAVAVAACGRPEALARCLQALAAQTLAPAEILVVDQEPSPDAREAAAACAVPVRYVVQARLGLSASRNLALAEARAPIVAVTDDDCVPDATWVAALAAAFGRPSPPGAVTGAILALGDASDGTYAISLRETAGVREFATRIEPWIVGSGANFAAPATLLRACGGWDERLGAGSRGQAAEDCELLDRLLARGVTVRYEPAAVVRHERTTHARRLATRWSYGFGIGALCGLRLAGRDPFALRMLRTYAGYHLRPLAGAARRRDGDGLRQHGRALGSLAPGLLYGLRASRRPATADGGGR